MIARRIVFVGAGHAHLFALKRAPAFTRRGIEVVTIAPEDFWYSGLATGVLGGRYEPSQDRVEVGALLGSAGRFMRDRIVALDPASRALRLANGETISYDVLSLNVGSEVRPIPGENDGVIAIKPLRNLAQLRISLEKERSAGRKPHLLIAGAGASGCEIAANLRALLGETGGQITLLSGTSRLAPAFSEWAAQRLARRLSDLGITVRLTAPVKRVEGRAAVIESGERCKFDFLINATGLHPPAWLAQSGLPVSEHGELIVDEFLRSPGDPRVFAGGDCMKLRGRNLEKIGVHAVRQAPVLFANLLATLEGRPLRPFHPQRHCLLILNLAHGYGLARWAHFYWFGRSSFWLKDQIDRAFLARYQRSD